MAALLERSSQGDHAAARVVVQYQLPGLLWLAAHGRPFAFQSRREALDELVSATWEVAVSGLPARGRSWRRALFYAVKWRGLDRDAERARRCRDRELPAGSCREPIGPGAPHPAAQVLDVLTDALAAGAITRGEARLVGSLTVGGMTCKRLGEAEGLCASAVSHRRVAAVRRLAEWAAVDNKDADEPA